LSEIQRSDARPSGDDDAASTADRDAKIEQLLLVGLDHYFAARYEHAINVWTRALFFDRNHPRARAYIERARSAQAERQRQSEELLHDGVAAFHRGEGDEARRLLQAAIDGGAPSEEAIAILERINRLGIPAAAADAEQPARAPRPARGLSRSAGGSRAGLWLLVAVTTMALAVGGSMVFFAFSTGADPLALFRDAPAVQTAVPIVQDLSLPLPRRGEMALARARALAADGRLHDAMTALDAVRASDPQKADADRLRADIQRQLLALTTMPSASPARRLP
jgi:tetratricopeptide (TPR) repeat protein